MCGVMFHWYNKKEKASRTSLSVSWLWVHTVTGCLQLLVPHSPIMIDYVLALWAQLNPSFLKVLCLRYVVIATRQVTSTNVYHKNNRKLLATRRTITWLDWLCINSWWLHLWKRNCCSAITNLLYKPQLLYSTLPGAYWMKPGMNK